MLVRWGIRIVAAFAGVVVGMLVADVLLDDFSVHGAAIVEATVIIWITTVIAEIVGQRVIRNRRDRAT